MRICVDSGKFAGKCLKSTPKGEPKKFYIRNKIEEVVSHDSSLVDGYIMEYQGKRYRIGENANNINYDVSKTSINHKLVIYLGITKLLETKDLDEPISLIVGCPMSTFVNKEKKDAFVNYLKGNVDLTVNNEKYSFFIQNVYALPESIGVPYQDTEKNKKRLIGVIDIGGLNVNGAIYDQLKPIKSSAFTINSGSLILHSKIKKLLNDRFDYNCQDYEIPYIIKNGVYINGQKNEDGTELVLSLFRQHLEDIFLECKKYNWNIGGLDIEFTGGGALDIKEAIEEFVPRAVVHENAIWNNVYAFDKLGEVLKVE